MYIFDRFHNLNFTYRYGDYIKNRSRQVRREEWLMVPAIGRSNPESKDTNQVTEIVNYQKQTERVTLPTFSFIA